MNAPLSKNAKCLEIMDRPQVRGWKVKFLLLVTIVRFNSYPRIFQFFLNGFNITFIRGPGASRPGTMRQRNMNSNFIQIDGGRLYGTAKMGQQENGMELVLNGSKPYVTNLKRTFLASLAKSASNLSRTFHASQSEGFPITSLFSHMPSLCHLMCLAVLLEINNHFKRGVIGK
jgi:hypothetical protein